MVLVITGTNAAALSKIEHRNALGDVVQEISEELHKMSTEINGRLLKLTQEFAEEFNKIVEEAKFDELFAGLHEQVAKINSEDTSIDFCGETAINEIEVLENYVKKHTFTCKYQVDGEFDVLKTELEILVQRVRQFNSEIARDVYVCMKQSHGNTNTFGECLKDKLEDIKIQMEDIKKIVLDTLTETENSFDFLKGKITECVVDAKKDVEEKAQDIINKMSTCVQAAKQPQLRLAKGDLFEIIQELTEQVSKIASELNVRMLQLVESFTEKFNKIVKEANFESIITNLREEIAKLNSEDASIDFCGETAINDVELLNKLVKEHTFTCKYEVDADLNTLLKALKNVFERVLKLNSNISKDFYVCMKESNGNTDKFSQCLKEKIDTIKYELKELEKEVMQTMDEVEKSLDFIMSKVSDCVFTAKKDVETKAELVVDTMKTCIQNAATSKHRDVPAIQDFYKVLADKIQEETMTVTVNLPQEITTLSDKVNIIVSDHNIEVLIVKIKEEIENLLSQSDKNTQECKYDVDSKVDLLVSYSQSALEQCVSDVQLVADDLEQQFKVLADKSAVLAEELSDNILVCAQENPTNIVAFTKCLAERAESLKDKVIELQAEVDKTVSLAVDTTKEAVQSLVKCMDKVEDETANKGQIIIEDLNKCIRNLELLF